MRGFSFILVLVSLVSLSGCIDQDYPALPVTVHLNEGYAFLARGDYQLKLDLPTRAFPKLSLETDQGKKVFSISEEFFSLESLELADDFANRSPIEHFKGTTDDGLTIEGKLMSSYAFIVDPAGSSGHHSNHDGREYQFSGELKRGDQVVGTISGDIKIRE